MKNTILFLTLVCLIRLASGTVCTSWQSTLQTALAPQPAATDVYLPTLVDAPANQQIASATEVSIQQ